MCRGVLTQSSYTAMLMVCCMGTLHSQILEVDPDILMLQDADNWKEWWQPELRRAVRAQAASWMYGGVRGWS